MIIDLSSLDQPIELDTASPTGEVKSLSKEELLTLVTKQNAANAVLTKQNAAHEEQNTVLTSTKRIALGEEGTGFNVQNAVLTSTELTALGEEGTGFNVQNAVLTSTELTALGEEGTGFNVESERSFSVKFAPDFTQVLLNKKVVCGRNKLWISGGMEYIFRLNTNTCSLQVTTDAGSFAINCKICNKGCGGKTIFDMNAHVPSLDVNTDRIILKKSAGIFTLEIKFDNKSGCDFNKWDVLVKASAGKWGYNVSPGWKRIITDFKLF